MREMFPESGDLALTRGNRPFDVGQRFPRRDLGQTTLKGMGGSPEVPLLERLPMDICKHLFKRG
jgi:hypothetical protein